MGSHGIPFISFHFISISFSFYSYHIKLVAITIIPLSINKHIISFMVQYIFHIILHMYNYNIYIYIRCLYRVYKLYFCNIYIYIYIRYYYYIQSRTGSYIHPHQRRPGQRQANARRQAKTRALMRILLDVTNNYTGLK